MANLLLTATDWKDGNNTSPPAEWNGAAYVFASVDTLTLTATAAAGDTLTGAFAGTNQGQGHQIAVTVNDTDVIEWGNNFDSFPASIAITLSAGDTVAITTSQDRCGFDPSFTLTPTADPAPEFTCDEPILEVWQPPADAYNLRIRAYAQSTAFAADTDVTIVDSRLVFLMALANLKAHYGQPDANAIANQFQLRLRKLRARNHNGQRYRPNGDWTPPPMPKISNPDAFD